MSAGSFLKGLAGHVVSGVESIQEFLGSEMARTAVITDLGGVPGPGAKDPPVFPTARLDAIKTYRDSVDPDKAADAAVLTDIAAVFDAIAGIVEVWGFTGAEADEVGHALLQLTASTYVRLRWPRLFLVLQAVTALEEKTSTYGAGSNSVVRLGSAAKALFDFLVDPGKTLESIDPDSPPDLDRSGIDLAVDTLLRLGAAVLGVLDGINGIDLVGDTLAGWDGPGLDLASDITPTVSDLISSRMVSFSIVRDADDPADDADLVERLMVTLAFVPKHQGGRQLFLALGGAFTADVPIGTRAAFSARLRSDAGVAMLIGHDPDLSGPRGDTSFAANLAFGSVPDPATGLTISIPRSTGTRLEIGTVTVTAGIDAVEGKLSISIGGAALVIDSDDADGLIRRLLGATPLRLPFDVTLGYGTEQGRILTGHAPPTPFGGDPSGTPSAGPGTAAGGTAGREVALTGPAPAGQSAVVARIPVGRRFGPVTVIDLGMAIVRSSSGVAGPDGTVPDDDQVTLVAEVSLSAQLGPVYLRLDRLGLGFMVDDSVPAGRRNLRFVDAHLSATLPVAISLAIETSLVSGGGTIFHDEAAGTYFGVFSLRLGKKLTLTAIGLVATRQVDGSPGMSMIIIATLQGLGWGAPVTLDGLGLLVAIDRTFDENAVRAALPTGQLKHLLFPADPVHHPAETLAPLQSFFPARRDSTLFGILVRLTFGRPPKITLDLALILQWGDSVSDRLLVLGRISSILPDDRIRAVTINLDAVGVFDPSAGEASLDAVLVDSKLCGRFPLTGSAALRRVPGPTGFALAIGGFHPDFPAPQGFPALERVTVALTSGENPKLICTAYLAVTSNTVQFGAEASLYAAARGFSITGSVGFDVLIQLWPPHFLAGFHASVQLKRGSTNLFKVSVRGELEGPYPLRVAGEASFGILWWDYTVDFDKTLVGGSAPSTLPAADVVAELGAGLARPNAWQADLPAAATRMVSVRRDDRAGGVLLHPLGTVTVSQGVVPLGLDRDIDRLGGARPSGARRFAITKVRLGDREQSTDPVTDEFAAGQYFDLSDDEALAAPSFELMRSGVRFGTAGHDLPYAARVADPFDYTDIVVDANGTPVTEPEPSPAGHLVLELARFGAAARAAGRQARSVRFETGPDPQAPVVRPQGWGVGQVADVAEPGHVGSWAEANGYLRESDDVVVPAAVGAAS